MSSDHCGIWFSLSITDDRDMDDSASKMMKLVNESNATEWLERSGREEVSEVR